MQSPGANFEPRPTGDALREHWIGRLPEGERRVLEEAVRVYPKSIEREEISEATATSVRVGIPICGGSAPVGLSSLSVGQVRASEELFG